MITLPKILQHFTSSLARSCFTCYIAGPFHIFAIGFFQSAHKLSSLIELNKSMRSAIAIIILLASTLFIRAEDVLSGPDMKKFATGATELGWKYFYKGDYDTALRRFQMAIRHDKDYAPAYYGVAYVYSNQGKLDDAIKYYRETIKRDKTYVYTYANLGYALLQKEQFREALYMLDKALDIDPNCGEAYLSYANYYAFKQDWKKAEQSVNKAVKYGQKLQPHFRKMLEQHGVKITKA